MCLLGVTIMTAVYVHHRDDSCLCFYYCVLGNYEHVMINHLCNYLIQGPSVKGCKRLRKTEGINPAHSMPNILGTLIINYDRFYTLLASVRDLIVFIC